MPRIVRIESTEDVPVLHRVCSMDSPIATTQRQRNRISSTFVNAVTGIDNTTINSAINTDNNLVVL